MREAIGHRPGPSSERRVRPHAFPQDVPDAYAQMNANEAREAEAEEWTEALLPDAADEMH